MRELLRLPFWTVHLQIGGFIAQSQELAKVGRIRRTLSRKRSMVVKAYMEPVRPKELARRFSNRLVTQGTVSLVLDNG